MFHSLHFRYKPIGYVMIALGLAGLIAYIMGFEPSSFEVTVLSWFEPHQPQALTLIKHNIYTRVCGMLYTLGCFFVMFAKDKKFKEVNVNIALSACVYGMLTPVILYFLSKFIIIDNNEVTIAISGSLPLFCIIYYNYFKWKYLKGEKARMKNLEKFKVAGNNVESPIHQAVTVKDLYPES